MFMFKWKIENNQFVFFVQEDGQNVNVSEWINSDNIIYFNSLQLLIDNGFGLQEIDRIVIPSINIYELCNIDKEIIGLPSFYPFDLYVQSDGQLNQNDFKYTVDFYSFAPGGERFSAKRQGPIVKIKDSLYLLTKEQYELCSAIEEFNDLDLKNKFFSDNLVKFSNIKNLSKASCAILDSYLSFENVIIPDKIKLNLNYHDHVLEITPAIESPISDKFSALFDRQKKVLDTYPIKIDDDNKARIVISEEQKEQLTKIKNQFRKVDSIDKIQAIIQNPDSFFETDVIDISEFYSDRVVEIGLYKPRFYPFISPYKSKWIPGVQIVDRVNGTTNISFKDSKALLDFEKDILDAESKGDIIVTHKGASIDISDAKDIVSTSKNQFEKNYTPDQIKNDNLKVLIIEENAEDLGYRVDFELLNNIDTLTLYKTDFLKRNISLKQHQEEGIAWLQYLCMNNQKGCLLADDMGLGKTLQILYLIDWHSRTKNSENKPYLIVAPVSLLENWENEYDKFFNNPKPKVTKFDSRVISKVYNASDVAQITNGQVVLTNYETIRSCQFNFCAVDFALIILDEAQKIKTPGTLVTNSVKALKGTFKIAMTGTPVENTLVDLWCIMDFSVPGLLGNAKDFSKKYQKPLMDADADLVELGNEIRQNLGNYFKRRLKRDVAKDLPKKCTKCIKTNMPKIQLERYKAEINLAIEKKENLSFNSGGVLQLIMRIRAISDHPYILDSKLTAYSSEELVATSAKLISTIEILNEVEKKGEKAIIFTDRKEVQRMIQKIIKDYYGITSRIINGDTPTNSKTNDISQLSRQQAIDYFQSIEGFNVIIMSPIAAGMGLNITEANHVIHYSRHWNPAKEEQATDRAYRIGQKKDVFVYYPMAVSDEFQSFDITLNNLLGKKSSLANATLFPTERFEVTQEELFESLLTKKQDNANSFLSIKDIDNLDDYSFEAFTSAFYKKKGYKVILTPKSNDRGVDVVALGEENYVIQSKHSKNTVNVEGIQEVVCGRKFYEIKYNVNFKAVLFTNSSLSKSALDLAQINNVQFIDGLLIADFLRDNPISYEEVQRCELSRICSV